MPLVQELNTELGNTCFKRDEVVDLENTQASSCSPSVRVDYDKAGCKGKDGECGKPICCAAQSGLTNCLWRGSSSSDCNGQCHAGEVKISSSSWGGTPGESGTGRCGRGSKAFCCEMGSLSTLLESCYWTSGNGKRCDDGDEEIAHKWDGNSWSTVASHGSSYCCPKADKMPLENCHWVGKGDCADNTCSATEVTLLTDNRGDSYSGCIWGRKKALCCTPNTDVLKKQDCDVDICGILNEKYSCDDDSGIPDESNGYFSKRSYELNSCQVMWEYGFAPSVEKRAKPGAQKSRIMTINVGNLLNTAVFDTFNGGVLRLPTRAYGAGLSLFTGDGARTLGLNGAYSMASDVCSSTAIKFHKFADLPSEKWSIEHMQEFQMIKKFLITGLTGNLPSGKKMKAALLDPYTLLSTWNKDYDVSLDRIGDLVTDVADRRAPQTPNERVMEVLGSLAYRTGLTLVPNSLNGVKAALWGLDKPVGTNKWSDLMRETAISLTRVEPNCCRN
ncbi:hypothetical protein BDV09DRAFT_31381 [Aspergillus tetrazonus]